MLICEEIFLKFHKILSCIEQSKLDTQTFLSVGHSVLIVLKINFEWEGKIGAIDRPIRKTFPTEFLIE